MLPVIAVCPSICAIGLFNAKPDNVTNLIIAINELSSSIRSSSDILFYGLEDVAEILATAGHFPVTDSIRTVLTETGLEEVYSVNDIRLAINMVIERPTPVSELSSASFVVVSSLRPKCAAGFSSLLEAFSILLAHLAIAVEQNRFPPGLLGIASAVPATGELIVFEAKLELIDPPIKIDAGYCNSLDVNTEFVRTASPVTFLQSIDPVTVWRTSSAENELQLAVKLFAQRLAQDAGGPPIVCHNFEFSNSFVKSLRKWEALGDRGYSNSVFEASARIVANMEKYEAKEMKSRSAGGKERPKVRSDGARAFRTHLSKSGVAMRLMFWRLANGSIEFANIGPKGELEIE